MDEKKTEEKQTCEAAARTSQTLKPKPVNVNVMRKLNLVNVNVNMKARVTDMARKKKLNG